MQRSERHIQAESAILVDAARQGDRRAFDELYQRYHRLVARRIVVLMGPGICEDDMLQDTFAVAYQKLAQYRGDAPFPHWLLGIATNQARSAHRKRSRLTLLPFLSTDSGPAYDDRAATYPELDALYKALESLSTRLREAVLLHDLEGLTLQEIAQLQQVSVNTAASRVRRGRKRLRSRLVAQGFERSQQRAERAPSADLSGAGGGLLKGETP